MYDFDLRGLFFFAVLGMAAAAIAVVVGLPLGAWWVFHHVSVAF